MSLLALVLEQQLVLPLLRKDDVVTVKPYHSNHNPQGAQRSTPSPELVEELRGMGVSPLISRAMPPKISALSEVQSLAIPRAIEGEDLVMLGRTGDGKTLAYGIPLFQRLLQMPRPLPHGVALIVVPSSHLAAQVREALLQLGKSTKILVQYFVENSQGAHLSSDGADRGVAGRYMAHIAVGTPKALLQASTRREFNLFDSSIVVLDEADLLLSNETRPAVTSLLSELRPLEERQTILVTATLPNEVIGPMAEIVPGANVVNAGIERPLDRIEHRAVLSGDQSPYSLVTFLIKKEEIQRGIVFCLYPADCEKLCQGLNERGIAAAPLFSPMDDVAQLRSIDALRDGSVRVLVATIQEGRGLDVSGMTHVINFDVPLTIEDYLQQSGRTGRGGQCGTCFTIVPPFIRREFDTMMTVLRINHTYVSTEFRNAGKALKFEPPPDSPERILKVMEEHCGHSFENPGLVLTAMDRNRRFADARETAVLLNIVGREVATLVRHQIRIAAACFDLPLPEGLTVSPAGFSPEEMSRLISALEVKSFVVPDKPVSAAFGDRVSNAEQAIFNLLGALLIDSESTEKATALVARILGVEALLRLFDHAREKIAVEPPKYDKAVGTALQGALGYTFIHPNLIPACFSTSQAPPESQSNHVPPFAALGSSVLQIFLVDAVRRSYVDEETGFIGSSESANLPRLGVPRFIRQRRDTLVQLTGRWNSSEFAQLDFALGPVLGFLPSTRPEVGNRILSRLIGAVFVDGGYAASKQCLDLLFPDLKFNSDRATEALLTAFDPVKLQECLTEAGEIRTERRAAQERARASQLLSKPRKRQERAPAQPTLPEVDFEVLLRAKFEEKQITQFRISTTTDKTGDRKIFTTVVRLNKRELSSHTDPVRKTSIQEACRAALGVLASPG